MHAPLISVIVPARNEEEFLGKCLESIRSQKFDEYELIVADGHSTDSTVKIAKQYADRVIFDKGTGVGAARNLAAKRARGEILAFTDADGMVCKRWLERISLNLNNKIGGVFGPVFFNDSVLNNVIAASYWIAEPLIWKVLGLPLAWASNCAYRKDIFLKIGGFRTDVRPIEDGICSFEASRLAEVMFDPRLVVWTSARRLKSAGSLRTILEVARASFQYLTKRKVATKY